LYLLLDDVFGGLPQEARKWYLSLIERLGDEKASQGAHREDAERFARRWQYTRLWPIRASLLGNWRRRFDALRDEFGDLEHPDFLVWSGELWTGPTTPKAAEDLRAMTFEELVSFLTSWRPCGEPMTPSPEGLGRALTAVIALEPERFASNAGRFKELDPTYVRGMLGGLREATKEKVFAWLPVLDLCQWVMEQPREIPEREGEYADLDPAWVWTRKAIADLLSSGFELRAAEIPWDLRATAWNVLRQLTDDPEPTPEYETHCGGSNMDPASLSINTTRGEAMHAVLRYALWVRHHVQEADDGKERIERGFDEMPEVRDVLNHHLDPDYDRSLAIRSVYGRWFPWLVLLDPRWAAQNVRRIFPPEHDSLEFWSAAWHTYIVFCKAYDNVFEILPEEYARAIGRIGGLSSDRRYLASPDERLGRHLAVLYWRGRLSLDDADGLLTRFYCRAAEPLRAHTTRFIGHALRQATEAVPPETLERLRELWEYRMSLIRVEVPLVSSDELASFGSWFTSEKFSDEWSLAQLKEVLTLAGQVEPMHWVLERLAALAPVMALATVECLGLVAGDERARMHMGARMEDVRSILASGLRSPEEDARRTAEDLVHRLGALGYRGLRDLLQT